MVKIEFTAIKENDKKRDYWFKIDVVKKILLSVEYTNEERESISF